MRRMWLWFYKNAVARSKFPIIENARNEQVKLNVLRIVFGLIISYRALLTAYSANLYYEPTLVLGHPVPVQFLGTLFILCLSIMYTVGVLTPTVGILLLTTYAALDKYLGIPSLGLCIFQTLIIMFVLANAGQMLSLDQQIVSKRQGRLKDFVQRQYDLFGFASHRHLRFYYFIAFVSYALTSMGAVFFHLQDYFWTHGDTVAAIMTSSFICGQYQFFRSLELNFPLLLKAMSVFAIVSQTVFQLYMIPLMYFRWGRIFVIAWGGIFVLLSATSLQLSYLPYLEIVLWLLLFCPNHYFASSLSEFATTWSGAVPVARRMQARWVPAFTLSIAAFTWIIYPIHFPVGEKIPLYLSLKKATAPLRDAIFYLGCWVPCVFNKEDLASSDCWITITRQRNGKEELVPLTARDGSRLSYHAFDPLYFGNQVIWRRSLRLVPRDEIIKRHKPTGFNYQLVEKVVNFDYRANNLTNELITYKVDVFKSDALNQTRVEKSTDKYQGDCIYSYYMEAAPEGFSKHTATKTGTL